MSASQLEIKQSIEASVTKYAFNWDTCPPKFSEVFKKVLSSEEEILDLQYQGVTNDNMLAYIAPFLDAHQHITTLNICGNCIGAAGARSLTSNTTLTTLNIRGNNIGDAGAEALAGNTTLKTLDISQNNISDAGILALVSNITLTALNINTHSIGAAGAKALAGNTTLRTLNVNYSNIGDVGARALASNTTLTTLDISWNGISAAGAGALAGNTTLTTLDISDNSIGDAGARALANNAILTTLDIRNNDIGDAGAEALASNTILTILNISNNSIRTTGARALANNKILTTLNISGNKIGDAGAENLASNRTLTSLNISSNFISAVGAGALARHTTLTILKISNNKIGDAGAMALANNETLTTLDVCFCFNHIIDLPGAQALIQCQQNRVEKYKNQKLAFLMGTRKDSKSSVQTFTGNAMFEIKLLGEMLDFIKPKLLNLIHDFSLKIMNAFSSCENNTPSASFSSLTSSPIACSSTAHEIKEKHERSLQAQVLRETNALHCPTLPTLDHNVEAVTFIFRSALPLSTSYFDGVTDDNVVKVSCEASEVEEKIQQEHNAMNAYVLERENADGAFEVQQMIEASIRERDDLGCLTLRTLKRKAEAITFSSSESASSSSSTETSTPGVPAVPATGTAEQRRQTVRNAWTKKFSS